MAEPEQAKKPAGKPEAKISMVSVKKCDIRESKLGEFLRGAFV